MAVKLLVGKGYTLGIFQSVAIFDHQRVYMLKHGDIMVICIFFNHKSGGKMWIYWDNHGILYIYITSKMIYVYIP